MHIQNMYIEMVLLFFNTGLWSLWEGAAGIGHLDAAPSDLADVGRDAQNLPSGRMYQQEFL